jgi:cytochrome b subunit of formate dehydrogenase
MIKKLFAFVGVIILGGILFLTYLNRYTSIQVDYLKGVADSNVFILGLFLVALSIFATVLILQGTIYDLEEKIKKQSRKSEKATIIKEESQDRIQLLEAKIETLEKALSDALKRD